MSKMEWIHPQQTVRPRSNGKVPVLLCLFVAGMTALVVYRWGHEKWLPVRAKPTYTATAYIVEHPGDVLGGTAAPGRVQGVAQPGAAVPHRVPFVNTDADPQRAREAADSMAELYVGDRRKEWRSRVEGQRIEARRSVEQARREHDESVARLEAFEQKLRYADAKQPSATTDVKSRPSMVTNPRWLELERQSVALIKRRKELLDDRTHLHPAVREVSDKIVELERRMADIPREIPDSQAEAEIEASRRRVAERLEKEYQRRLAELTAAVEQTKKTCEEAELAERRAMQWMQSGPQYSVEHARLVENPPPVDYGWRRLMWTTLAAGLMMAFGAGSLSLGAGIEPPVATAAEVRAKTGKSIIGTIPADDPTPDAAEIGRQRRIRRTTIVLGLLLMVACPAVAIWGVLGI
ncbi:MAG: hypothetical protein KKE86_05550 [Planctomycetes bacterium]|nr:hypothetical protein [Planctomycetota bacterium]MBU4398786.1 hypothetical protein [Planctomycetota bacterium]MCG2683538.1 hypothetical protein [Planctomycetales bacterium]